MAKSIRPVIRNGIGDQQSEPQPFSGGVAGGFAACTGQTTPLRSLFGKIRYYDRHQDNRNTYPLKGSNLFRQNKIGEGNSNRELSRSEDRAECGSDSGCTNCKKERRYHSAKGGHQQPPSPEPAGQRPVEDIDRRKNQEYKKTGTGDNDGTLFYRSIAIAYPRHDDQINGKKEGGYEPVDQTDCREFNLLFIEKACGHQGSSHNEEHTHNLRGCGPDFEDQKFDYNAYPDKLHQQDDRDGSRQKLHAFIEKNAHHSHGQAGQDQPPDRVSSPGRPLFCSAGNPARNNEAPQNQNTKKILSTGDLSQALTIAVCQLHEYRHHTKAAGTCQYDNRVSQHDQTLQAAYFSGCPVNYII